MKKLLFFCIASAILIFSIIVVNIAPIINHRLGRGAYDASGASSNNGWSDVSCKSISDQYNIKEDQGLAYFSNSQEIKDKELKDLKKQLNKCNRKKAMVGLEISVFNINIILGAICTFLGLLVYLETINIGKKVGLIGLGCGGIGFILTLVYVIESGLIFNDVSDEDLPRIDSDGALFEWNDSKKRYICIFYEKDNEDSIRLRYSDYGISYLNYRKDISYLSNEKNHEYNGCHYSTFINVDTLWTLCISRDEDPINPSGLKTPYYDVSDSTKKIGDCEKLYYYDTTSNNNKKILYDCWLTTIILSCFIILFSIGLAIFGFLLFRDSNGSSGSVEIK